MLRRVKKVSEIDCSLLVFFHFQQFLPFLVCFQHLHDPFHVARIIGVFKQDPDQPGFGAVVVLPLPLPVLGIGRLQLIQFQFVVKKILIVRDRLQKFTEGDIHGTQRFVVDHEQIV